MTDSQNATAIKAPTGGGTVAHHGHAWVLVTAFPALMWALAVLTLVAWYLATQFSMNTSEAWFYGFAFGKAIKGVSAVAHFSIPDQFIDLFGGHGLSQSQLMTEGYGFFLEVLNLTFAIGVAYAFQVVQKASGTLSATVANESNIRHGVFMLFLIALLCFDVYSSATYGNASPGGSILFAVLLQFVAFFFLPLGIIFIRAALILRK
jgi:hypothetical protein